MSVSELNSNANINSTGHSFSSHSLKESHSFDLRTVHQQISKLNKITRLISEGHYFLYHPSVDDENDPMLALAENFNIMVKKLKESQEELENKVEQRTYELRETARQLEYLLEEAGSLKKQQDADYFLTSLLFESFAANRSESDCVHFQFLIDQKKKFHFNDRQRSIGGDFCGAYSISLCGRKFSVFINADAMGKSIQGAAGALVLGAVFDAIVQRTRLSEAFRGNPPEIWIRDAFTEIQKVFESFDGRMLIALFLGLLDEQSGLLYFINADYPFPVLLRNGIAELIRSDSHVHKVGLNLSNLHPSNFRPPLRVHTLLLKYGDMIISGSDGREIVEDENTFSEKQFPGIVQTAKGDLKTICHHLEQIGPVADDLSLMQLRYLRQPIRKFHLTMDIRSLLSRYRSAATDPDRLKALLDLSSAGFEHPDILYKICNIYLKRRNYSMAVEYGRRAHAEDPANLRLLFLLGVGYEGLGNNRLSLQSFERIRLRDPENPHVLRRLIKIYKQLGRKEKVEYLEFQLSNPGYHSSNANVHGV